QDRGVAALILPLGICTDMSTKDFFGELIRSGTLVEVWGFINEEMLFRDVLHNFKFCILVMGTLPGRRRVPTFVFTAYNVEEAKDPMRRFSLTSDDIKLLNPLTETCPTFFFSKSAEITKSIYRS